MSMYSVYINDATAQIEKSCREIRECASKLVESAPSASTNNARAEIAALVAHYDNRNDNGSFIDYIGSRIEAMRQLSPVA